MTLITNGPFNTQTFNGPPQGERRVIRRIFDPSTLPAGQANRSTGRTDPTKAATSSDAPRTVTQATTQPVTQRGLAGNFALVRAAAAVNQHRVDFWTKILPYMAANTQSDPSVDQLDAMYSDMQLFSYLPESLQPSKEDFRAWSSPTKRAAVLAASLANLGLAPEQAGTTPAAEVVTIPAPPAFAENKQGLVATPRVGPALAFKAELYSV